MSEEALLKIGDEVFPYQEQFGYYGVCGVDGDFSECPFTARLLQRLRDTNATLCRCQNPSPTREMQARVTTSGGTIHVRLDGGRTEYELVVVNEKGILQVDDELCDGEGEDSSIYTTTAPCNSLP